jgi:phage-related baseplate assembly protein
MKKKLFSSYWLKRFIEWLKPKPSEYDEILSRMVSDLEKLNPDFIGLKKGSPTFVVLQIAAQREIILRQKINDAARLILDKMEAKP